MQEHLTIDAIEICHYRLPLDPPFHAAWDPTPRAGHPVTLVRVRAGDYEGVGAGDAMLGFPPHANLFIGQSPFTIRRHVHLLDNLQFHYGRMWPLEIALWDLMGQITGQPLWKLLGGTTGRVPVYASTGQRMSCEERVSTAKSLHEAGFPGIKIRFYHDQVGEDLRVARAIREVIGPEMALLVDANQGWQMAWDERPTWDLQQALYVADALAEIDAYWLEEPLHRHDVHGLAALRNRARVRVAGGEGNRSYASLLAYLEHRSLDVYQPDVAWSTGILRGVELAAMVRAAGHLYSPHTWGDGIVLLANLHVAAACSTAPFIEFPYDPPYWTPERRDFILPEPLVAREGAVLLSNAPGLGVQIDWARLEAFRVWD